MDFQTAGSGLLTQNCTRRSGCHVPPGTVSRSQCTVTVYPDGNALLTSKGSCAPTLLRSQGGQWTALYDGQTQWLQNGDQIGLDASNPESAVFTCQQTYPQQGGYGY